MAADGDEVDEEGVFAAWLWLFLVGSGSVEARWTLLLGGLGSSSSDSLPCEPAVRCSPGGSVERGPERRRFMLNSIR